MYIIYIYIYMKYYIYIYIYNIYIYINQFNFFISYLAVSRPTLTGMILILTLLLICLGDHREPRKEVACDQCISGFQTGSLPILRVTVYPTVHSPQVFANAPCCPNLAGWFFRFWDIDVSESYVTVNVFSQWKRQHSVQIFMIYLLSKCSCSILRK